MVKFPSNAYFKYIESDSINLSGTIQITSYIAIASKGYFSLSKCSSSNASSGSRLGTMRGLQYERHGIHFSKKIVVRWVSIPD